MTRIRKITRKQITTEKLYNLSVKEDETFIANGIVVHNCKSFIRPILKLKPNQKIEKFKPSTKKIEDTIQFSDIIEASNQRCQAGCCINL